MSYENTEVNTIRNKDIAVLRRVMYAMQGAYAAEVRRLWQQDRLFNITQKLTGMPGGHGGAGGLEGQFEKISELEEMYAGELDGYIAATEKANAILKGIEDDAVRVLVTLKYVLDMSDREIQARLNMTRRRYKDAIRHIEGAESMQAVKIKFR